MPDAAVRRCHMAVTCPKCGKLLSDSAKFCSKCGSNLASQPASQNVSVSPQPEPKIHSVLKPSSAKKKVSRVILPKIAKPVIREKKPTSDKPQKQNTMGFLDRILCVSLAVLIAISAFRYPGFLIPKKNNPGISGGDPVINDTLSDTKESFQEVSFHSDPVDITPVEGVRITCEKDQLYEDTTLSFTEIPENDERVQGITLDLQQEGIYALGAWEFDGGLTAEESFPGEYHMAFDLAKLDIPEELWSDVRAYRVDANNELTEYAGDLSGGSYQITGNRNSVTLLGVGLFIGFMAVAIPVASGVSEDIKAHWYYSRGDGKIDRDTDCGSYRLRFKMRDVDTDQSDIIERLTEIEESRRKEAEEDFKADEQVRNQSKGSLWRWFNENKSVAARLKELLANDEEYQRLSKQIELPEAVQEVVRCIETSYQYLAKHEFIRIPKNRVEFMIKKLEGENPNLGEAVSHWVHSTYVHIDMRDPEGFVADDIAGKTRRDNLLLTVTHELFHICQDEYHFKNFGTSIRYDEMVTLVLESDAKEYYKDEGIITTDPALTRTDYWMTMFSSVDQINGSDDFQQHQGYLLSTLAQFLRKKTGNNVSPVRMMNARSSFRAPQTSKVLMTAFNLSEKEFDRYFREWAVDDPRSIQGSIGSFYEEMRAVYPKSDLSADSPLHVPMKSGGDYVIGYREYVQNKDEPAALLILFDEPKNSARRDMSLVPYGKYDQVEGGLFVLPQNKMLNNGSSKNRRMLEIYGKLESKNKYNGSSGYTIFSMYAPKKPVLAQQDDQLTIRFDQLSPQAAQGKLNGMELHVWADNGYDKVFDVRPDQFSPGVILSTADILNSGEMDNLAVSVTVREYVNAFRGGYNLYGPQSEPAVLSLSSKPAGDAIVYSGLQLKSDTLTNFEANEKPDDAEMKYSYGPWPTNNTVTIQGDTVTVDVGALNFGIHGQDRKDAKIVYDETYTRDAFTVKGKILYQSESSISCQLTEVPKVIKASIAVDAMDAEYAGNDVTYLPLHFNQSSTFKDIDLYYDSLEIGSSCIELRFEGGKLTSAEIVMRGTLQRDRKGNYDGETINDTDESNTSKSVKLVGN